MGLQFHNYLKILDGIKSIHRPIIDSVMRFLFLSHPSTDKTYPFQPVEDHIYIHRQLPRVEFDTLRNMRQRSTSVVVRVNGKVARERQCQRFEGISIASNADMRPAQIRKYCVLDESCQALIKSGMRQLQLPARAYHRMLKLSWTIADLAGSEVISQMHLG